MDVVCDDFVTSAQCVDNSLGTPVDDKCAVYDDICKLKCEYITPDTVCNHRAECFWLTGNASTLQKTSICSNKV
jgi:hypothetical protein